MLKFIQELEYARQKKLLKAAFRRKPKPAKVDIKDEDVPVDAKLITNNKERT